MLNQKSKDENMERDSDFIGEYRKISNKLKKRFLRKPNLSEASAEFYKLGKRLVKDDEQEYAGLCNLAVARCEQNNDNSQGECEAYIESGRLFMKAERKVFQTGNYSFEYHLAASIDCYSKAIRLLGESPSASNSARAFGLCHEAAKCRTASQYLLESVHAKEKVAKCYIDTGDYHNALNSLTEISRLIESYGPKHPSSIYLDILRRCEITRVLLLLIIKPTPQNLSPNLTSILEKYAWDSSDDENEDSPATYAPEEVFLLLQSVVMASQVNDGEALIELEDDLVLHLDEDQRELLRNLANSPPQFQTYDNHDSRCEELRLDDEFSPGQVKNHQRAKLFIYQTCTLDSKT
ncbi:F8A [Lepeophtheirus salmonis]|uniref:F8A n=1 Tax=Lepeophtheirus salmonis TaxID=72036 RepID=A0A7R8D4J4_LEPSM|nr:F8A [Lepeophtheirus salmonis]CAF2995051.1 F8A [Lepeophtheirus salmonis]